MHIRTLQLTILILVAGCASNSDPAASRPEPDAPPPATHTIASKAARITYSAEQKRLGTIVREIGEMAEGGIVTTHGIERRLIDSVAFEHASMEEVANKLASLSECTVQATPNYYLLLPKGYEVLRDVSLAGKLPANYNGLTAQVTFGAGTQLYNVFRIMSKALNITIVADNAVAAAECGEISLGEVPLQESIEALLKSALIAPNAFGLKATEDYLFFYAANRNLPETQLLEGRDLVQRTRELLATRINLELPHATADSKLLDIELGARRLRDALPELAAQIGFRVVAEERLLELPVNPVAMHNVEVRDAMDLLIGQWLVEQYGYQVTADRIVIRQRQTGE